MKLNSKNSSPYHMNHSEDKPVTVSVCFDRCPMSLHQSHSHGQIGGWDGTGFAQDLDAERAIQHLYWWIKWCWLQFPLVIQSMNEDTDGSNDADSSFPLSFNLWMKTMAWWHQNCSQSQSVKGLPQVHNLACCFQVNTSLPHQMPAETSNMIWCVYVHVLPLVHLLI